MQDLIIKFQGVNLHVEPQNLTHCPHEEALQLKSCTEISKGKVSDVSLGDACNIFWFLRP